MAAFPTTRWTLIRQANNSPTPESRRALESLCQQYAGPVLGFVRHRVRSIEQAEDIAQGFFAQVIENNLLGRANEDRGRFRTFLLHALRGYIADVHDFDSAKKRGGGRQIVTLDSVGVLEPQQGRTPDEIFDMHWVRTLLASSLTRLEDEYRATNRVALFDALREFLDGHTQPPVKEVARQLNMSEPAVRVAVHRLRKRLGQIIRTEIAETVPNESDIDDELNRLMQILETSS